MFLISFSENIVSSLAAVKWEKTRDGKKEIEDKENIQCANNMPYCNIINTHMHLKHCWFLLKHSSSHRRSDA